MIDTETIVRPTSTQELVDIIADAAATGSRLELLGGGSKRRIGAPAEADTVVDMTAFCGVVDYDPAELVLTVRAGTPLAEVEALVAGHNQRLAFDPFDHGPIFDKPEGAATIGGILAAGVAGSRRLSAGSARDHLLGFQAVSGRGEAFVAGAKVVKNVTGYDLPKLACGSWGRLIAMTEVTLKVLPAPPEEECQVIEGLDFATAVAAMSKAMGSPADVSAAAYLPADIGVGERSRTALRVEGFGPSVAARCRMLQSILEEFGPVQTLPQDEAARVWSDLRTLTPLDDHRYLWRVNVPPSSAAGIVEALRPCITRWMADWAGGLLWLCGHINQTQMREVAAAHGGHATLVRSTREMRGRVRTFHPQQPAIAMLEERIRRAFDPSGVFETRRFLDVPTDA